MQIREHLTEQESLWDKLAHTQKPIYLYGMGDGALKIMRALERIGVKPAGIFASSGFQRGHSFEGYPVESLEQVEAREREFIILLAFGTFREPLLSYLYELSERHELYAPDVPVVPEVEEDLFDLNYLCAHEQELSQVEELLADEQSKNVFWNVLNYKISGKLSYLKACSTPMDEVYDTILHLDKQEDYVDLGAYNGDTILEFLEHTGGSYASITAFEPDRRNFNKLVKRIEELGLSHVHPLNCASHSKPDTLLFAQRAGRHSALHAEEGVPTTAESVDHVCAGKRVSVLKLDVEGAEEQALLGAVQSIRAYHPKILLSAYHKNSDLFRLPLLVQDLYSGYKIYLRHHPYVPAWETNFYFAEA